MPPLPLLAAPVLLLVLLVLLLMLRRSSGAKVKTKGAGPATARDAEEVRLLRLQVETLTEALTQAQGEAAPAALAAPAVPAALAAPAEKPVEESAEVAVDEPEAEDPVVEAPVEPVAEPVEEPISVEHVEPAPTTQVVGTPPIDHTAHAYADLSRTLARQGRLREAALAQWAADLRILGPLLEERGDELCEALAGLAPADPGMAVSGARAVASALVGPSVAVTAMLPDASHLSGPAPAGRPEPAIDVSSDVLPDDVVRALESVLTRSAEEHGDVAGVSVGLRCDLVAHVVPTGASSAGTVENVVRDVLEPYERPHFDAVLAGFAS